VTTEQETAHGIVYARLAPHATGPHGDLALSADRAAVIAVAALSDAGRLLPVFVNVEQARAEGRTEAANFLRAFADRHHQPGEGYAQLVDYGTGTEYGLACTCGADWGESERYDGCEERLEILAEADRIEASTKANEVHRVPK
jgi:hypothetical protein